jgi:hypothetical protein
MGMATCNQDWNLFQAEFPCGFKAVGPTIIPPHVSAKIGCDHAYSLIYSATESKA